MIKKLDKLIFKSFIGPFVVTFFIAFFVLMMQNLWKYIDDLVGKGLDFFTLVKFIWYASATLSALAMPIAILISSIMTFGNLGESFELVAIKSSGISLLRFMRPLVWFTVLLCFVTFLFANYVIPYSELKFVTLYKDIRVKKPALNMQEGVFYTEIPGYSIKISSKSKEGDKIGDVLIYDQANALQDNTVIARSGKMSVTPDNNYLEFNLQNGTRYEEKGAFNDSSNEYIRLQFKTLKKLFDLSSFNAKAAEDTNLQHSYKMLNAAQLDKNIDSLSRVKDSISKALQKSMVLVMPYFSDSTQKLLSAVKYTPGEKLFPDSVAETSHDRAAGKANELKNTLFFNAAEKDGDEQFIMYHKIEWHRKFAFSLACMVLFFIGAPLGSIIRKGGLGMPLVVAIVFFLIFHLLNMFGEKFVKSGLLSPFWGMWLAIMVLTPVGVFFTYKAMHDSQLFNKERYTRFFSKAVALIRRKKEIKNDI